MRKGGISSLTRFASTCSSRVCSELDFLLIGCLIVRVDLTTRRGLKRVHADFTRIYDRMNTVYNNNLDKEKVTGGIVGIWAKMSTDSILRNKLFEKGKLNIHHYPAITAFILSFCTWD